MTAPPSTTASPTGALGSTPGSAPDAGACFDYCHVREQILDGDVLLFQGTALLSRFIRWGSKSAYSHAGLALWWGERLMVIQAANRGVEVLPASTAVDQYSGQVDWFQPLDEARAELDSRRLIHAAFDELGKPFGVFPLVALAARMFRRADWDNPDPEVANRSYFCSQLVSRCYRNAGVNLVPRRADQDTSPGDLARSELLLRRGVLMHHPTGTDAGTGSTSPARAA
jgi:hypothetical protein